MRTVEQWRKAVANGDTEQNFDWWRHAHKEEWKAAVAAGKTTLGYLAWIEAERKIAPIQEPRYDDERE
jgi:hypothetical protein